MNENEYRTGDAQDEDLSPTFTRDRRPIPRRQVSAPSPRSSAPTDGKQKNGRTSGTGRISPNTPTPHKPPEEGTQVPVIKQTPPIRPGGEHDRVPVHDRPSHRPETAKPSRPGEAEETRETVGSEASHSGASRKKRRRITVLLLAVVVLFGGVWLFSNAFLTVREVTVLGAESAIAWTEEGILSVAAIEQGTPMYRVDADAVSARISEAFASLSGAEVTKIFPGKIVIAPVSATPAYRFRHEDKTYVLSSELKVLAEATEAYVHLPELVLGNVVGCELGGLVAFSGEYDRDIVLAITRDLALLLNASDVDLIDLENKFSIAVIYKSKYKLLFGDRDKLAQKVLLVQKTLEDPQFVYGSSAEIDVSSGNKAIVKFTGNGN